MELYQAAPAEDWSLGFILGLIFQICFQKGRGAAQDTKGQDTALRTDSDITNAGINSALPYSTFHQCKPRHKGPDHRSHWEGCRGPSHQSQKVALWVEGRMANPGIHWFSVSMGLLWRQTRLSERQGKRWCLLSSLGFHACELQRAGTEPQGGTGYLSLRQAQLVWPLEAPLLQWSEVLVALADWRTETEQGHTMASKPHSKLAMESGFVYKRMHLPALFSIPGYFSDSRTSTGHPSLSHLSPGERQLDFLRPFL